MGGGNGLNMKGVRVWRLVSECTHLLGGVDALANFKRPPVSQAREGGRMGEGEGGRGKGQWSLLLFSCSLASYF